MVDKLMDNLIIMVGPKESLFNVAQRIASEKVTYYGIAAVIDEKKRVIGVINDGDFLQLITRQADLSQSVETAMIKNPITVPSSLSHEEIIADVRKQLRERGATDKDWVRYVLIVDEDGVLVNVLRYVDLLSYYKGFGEKVAIYGQGFIGLTLSAALANRGHSVTGIDVSEKLIKALNQGQIHIFEPRLGDTVMAALERESLQFDLPDGDFDANVYIIAVGSPVDSEGKVDLSAVETVCRQIGARLKRGDLVMLRSTVPAGTTRNRVKPLLEKLTGLTAGHDFYLAFTPERTVEGQAMAELVSLPQIVGGLTHVCTQKASTFWGTLTDSVIHVQSLEAAELVKLINNSFRDLSFSFSNAFAMLCDNYNLDAFQVISAANEGYPRNRIPSPSPGVGGYCLSKDPYLYASGEAELDHARLAKISRQINQVSAAYPVKVFDRYIKHIDKNAKQVSVLLVGLAFKGWPETNDLRGSSSLEVARLLKERGVRVLGWDAVVKTEEIEKAGLEPAEFPAACGQVDVIFILNNHPRNTPEGLIGLCKGRKTLIFDGWAMLDHKNIEQVSGMTYATMGYCSPLK